MLCPGGGETRKIPLNAPSNGRELSEIRPIFERAQSEHCQLTARIDRIDQYSLFGNGAAPGLAPGCTPFPSRLGTTQVREGLSLLYTNYLIVYLRFVTTPGSFCEGSATLTPGGQNRDFRDCARTWRSFVLPF